jgi:hypothetical protein
MPINSLGIYYILDKCPIPSLNATIGVCKEWNSLTEDAFARLGRKKILLTPPQESRKVLERDTLNKSQQDEILKESFSGEILKTTPEIHFSSPLIDLLGKHKYRNDYRNEMIDMMYTEDTSLGTFYIAFFKILNARLQEGTLKCGKVVIPADQYADARKFMDTCEKNKFEKALEVLSAGNPVLQEYPEAF